MYSYNNLIEKLKIDNVSENRKYIKSIIHALVKNNDAIIINQKVDVNYQKVEYLYSILDKLKKFFDYEYSTKIDLTNFLQYVLNGNKLNINAIFCPGYTSNGYKNYIGHNNTSKMDVLSSLSIDLDRLKILADIKIILANVFLENTNDLENPNWEYELALHENKFLEEAEKHFQKNTIIKLSSIFPEKKYIKGFIDDDLCYGKTYYNFYKNNINFYKKMGWDEHQIKYRNDKLFTIYNIISNYIKEQENSVYIPMETMYSRSKVMTNNDVCTMYLRKK